MNESCIQPSRAKLEWSVRYQILEAINKDTDSEFNYWYFTILDEQSIKDNPVVIAGYYDEKHIKTTRTDFNTYSWVHSVSEKM